MTWQLHQVPEEPAEVYVTDDHRLVATVFTLDEAALIAYTPDLVEVIRQAFTEHRNAELSYSADCWCIKAQHILEVLDGQHPRTQAG